LYIPARHFHRDRVLEPALLVRYSLKTVCLKKSDIPFFSSVELADRLFERMKGLIGRRSLPVGRAILLRPCNSIHTMLMRFHIDVIFLNKNGEVLRIVKDLPPCRFAFGGKNARSALEMKTGWFDWSTLCIGDELAVESE